MLWLVGLLFVLGACNICIHVQVLFIRKFQYSTIFLKCLCNNFADLLIRILFHCKTLNHTILENVA
jgi:hypothetical protein